MNSCCLPNIVFSVQEPLLSSICLALSVSPHVQCCFARFFSYPDYRMAYDENTALSHILLRLKFLRP